MKMARIVTALLSALARLPLGALYMTSDCLYPLVYYVVGYRKKVVRQNLGEAFPEMNEKERRKIERAFYRYLCDIVVETVKLFHISDEELRRRISIENAEPVRESARQGRSAVLLLGHYGNWEWVQEISRCFGPCVTKATIYHPLRNHTWNAVMQTLRSRWHTNIVPMASAVRFLLDSSHIPWICGFIADHRPRKREPDASVEFLHHEMAFIYGPETIGRKVGADFFFVEMERMKRGYYRITFRPLGSDDGSSGPYPCTRQYWSLLENVIKRKPAYWLWSHKRWKFDKTV